VSVYLHFVHFIIIVIHLLFFFYYVCSVQFGQVIPLYCLDFSMVFRVVIDKFMTLIIPIGVLFTVFQ